MRLFQGKPVRKNVTLDARAAQDVERLALVSGLSQGEILNIALEQPFMRRLRLFVRDDVESPIAEVIDEYQGGWPGSMSMTMSANLIGVLRRKILPKSMFPVSGKEPRDTALHSVNEYVAIHIQDSVCEAYPVFNDYKRMAFADELLTYDPDGSRANIDAYLGSMEAYNGDELIYANDFLFRNLVVIFRDFCPHMAFDTVAEGKRYQYEACAELLGGMFPVKSSEK